MQVICASCHVPFLWYDVPFFLRTSVKFSSAVHQITVKDDNSNWKPTKYTVHR